MAGLEKVRPGERFRPRAQEWNSFVDAARYVRDRSSNIGAETGSAGDMPVVFRNRADTDIPLGGVCWVPDAVCREAPIVDRPAHPCISRFVIASKPCTANGPGAGWFDGVRPVRMSDWDSITIGQRIGADFDSWEAVTDPLGPMLVLSKLDSPLVLALITGRRGDHKMCNCGSSGPSGPYQVILLGPGHTVTEDSPGNLTMETV